MTAIQDVGMTLSRPGAMPGYRPRLLMTVDAVGGVWRYAMELARALTSRGVDVIFLCLGPKPARQQVVEAEETGTLLCSDHRLDWMAQDKTEMVAACASIDRVTEEHDIDLLHLNAPAQAAHLKTDLPRIVVSHSCMPSWWYIVRGGQLPEDWEWRQRENRQGFEAANATIVPSGAHADILTECYGRIAGLEVVHNGIGAVLHGQEKESFAFAAGRWWDEGKNGRIFNGIDNALGWPLVLAGAKVGPSGETAGYAGETLGDMPHHRVMEFMRRAAVVVSPSLYEPFGLAVLEAARAGAAVAVANIPTYRELWRDAVLYFDPRDPRTLREALSRLAGDPALRQAMGDRALAASRRYTPSRQAEAMLAIYGGVCPAFAGLSETEA